MDLDAYSAAHRDEWDRLAQLGAKRSYTGAEADELIEHYQSGSSQLSAIKTTAGQSVQGDLLSLRLSRARLRFTGASTNVLSRIPNFFVAQLPAALYRIRWLTLAVTAATFVIAFLYAWWIIANPQVIHTFGLSDADLEKYANADFVNYYSDNTQGAFTALVWTNNAWLCAQCVIFGIIGVYTPYLLFSNGQSLGESAGLLYQYGNLDTFFLYIAPHGQLELYSVFLSGAAGLRIFWSWIAPGAMTRAQSLAHEGRALVTVVVGLTIFLLMSGIIEGFVTRLDWPWPIKIGIGTVALAIVVTYQWVIGGRAFRAGETGDLDEFEAGARQIIAA
ncbi:MAG: stage II sporulation protein M [Rhodoglobus sp.]